MPFSSAVAVAMMIRELAPSLAGKSINTPHYQRLLKHPCCDLRHDWVHIRDSSTVKIAEASSDADKFDLKLVVGGYPILVDLIYKGKPRTTLVEADLQAAKAGVLSLDCDSFLFSSPRNNRNKRFSEAVADFVLKTGERKWRYHPRQVARLQAARENHQCRRGYTPVDIRKPVHYSTLAAPIEVIRPRLAKPLPPPRKKQPSKRYHCVLCDLDWVHDFTEPQSFPGCHILQHEILFSSFLKCWIVRPVPRVALLKCWIVRPVPRVLVCLWVETIRRCPDLPKKGPLFQLYSQL